jgi:peptidoglycan/LPS O-acetylase OafA/YrhL
VGGGTALRYPIAVGVVLGVALGVAAVVYGESDDSPGLQLIGVLIVVGVVIIGGRRVRGGR